MDEIFQLLYTILAQVSWTRCRWLDYDADAIYILRHGILFSLQYSTGDLLRRLQIADKVNLYYSIALFSTRRMGWLRDVDVGAWLTARHLPKRTLAILSLVVRDPGYVTREYIFRKILKTFDPPFSISIESFFLDEGNLTYILVRVKLFTLLLKPDKTFARFPLFP